MADSEMLFKLSDLSEWQRRRVHCAANAIIERARACPNEAERVKMLHDWLVSRCTYGKTAGSEHDSYTAYGALVAGRAVCAGIAQAFGYLCRQTFMECRFVVGYSGQDAKQSKGEDDGDHAWNMVRVDGAWYHIDVTHDLNQSAGFIRYDYFLLSDAEAATSRAWHAPSYPRCPAPFGYYRRAGLFAADPRSLDALLARKAAGGRGFAFQMPVFPRSDDDEVSKYLSRAMRKALAKDGSHWKSFTLRFNHKRGVYQITPGAAK